MLNKKLSLTSKRASSRLEQKLACLVIVLLWASISPALSGQQDAHATLTPRANRKPAPAFQVVADSGAKIRLADYRGKVVLLNFWATECGGCVREIPSFIEIEKAYKGMGFAAIGISMDISYESLKDANEAWAKVRPFMAKRGINYTIAMGDDAISKAYKLNEFPDTYLIDKAGRIAVSYVGLVVDKDNVAANVTKLLSEK